MPGCEGLPAPGRLSNGPPLLGLANLLVDPRGEAHPRWLALGHASTLVGATKQLTCGNKHTPAGRSAELADPADDLFRRIPAVQVDVVDHGAVPKPD